MIIHPFEIFAIATLSGLLLGMIISRLSHKDTSSDQLLEERKKSLIKEKEIAGDLYESLYDLHKGLTHTVRSYDSALKTVLEKLPTPVERLEELEMTTSSLKSIELREIDLKKKLNPNDSDFVLSQQVDILEEETLPPVEASDQFSRNIQ